LGAPQCGHRQGPTPATRANVSSATKRLTSSPKRTSIPPSHIQLIETLIFALVDLLQFRGEIHAFVVQKFPFLLGIRIHELCPKDVGSLLRNILLASRVLPK
jgi:hypothetical protein